MRRAMLVALAVATAVSCARTSPTAESRAHEIEAQVWSPYCPGRLLIDCTTAQARDLRGTIARRVERGDTNAEVLRWIRIEYGEGAVARPEVRGSGLAIWLVPLALFVLGALIVMRVLRRWTSGASRPVT